MRDLDSVARTQPASGNVVIVGIDDRSLHQLKRWPWPRRHYATIIENLSKAGAREIFFDIDFSSASTPEDDEILRKTLARQERRVTLPTQLVTDPASGRTRELSPIPALRKEVELASIYAKHDLRGQVRQLYYVFPTGGELIPSLAAKIAQKKGALDQTFPIDFSIDPRTIPTYSAIDVMDGKIGVRDVAGKSIIVGATSSQLGDEFMVPGRGMLSGIYLQALGAETLWAGAPTQLSFLLPGLIALVAAVGLAFIRDVRLGAVVGAVTFLVANLVRSVAESNGVVADIVPSLLLLLIVVGGLTWTSLKHLYRSRGSMNSVSGLPNLNVLREENDGRDEALVVAKVHNYAEIASALSPKGEEALIQQIARRLTLISPLSKLYQSDDGIFAWFESHGNSPPPGEHLNALYRIFRSPMAVLESQVDVSMTFGMDRQKGQPLASRLGSAVVASDEALKEGLEWKQYDPSRHEDMAWKLSILSQLDRAIDTGNLWVAFQPKLDLSSRKIMSAEALARWDHPEKGPISPAAFISAAEQSGRIGKLTDFVLARSIEAAARLKGQTGTFNVAVNLSARLIYTDTLTDTICKLLKAHRLPPECLTLEVTETAALAGSGDDLGILEELRAMGVRLSIDDYGTGMSTLDYMKRIPASEIKIDKSFVQSIDKSRSDRLMVHSTIQLAHSLGQKVVAEGVERTEILEVLAQLGCDTAQGYLIGHPAPLEVLEKRLKEDLMAA